MFKSILKKIIPKFIFKFYHWLLAWLGALFYGFPSRKMIVVGVTGTKGKSTVSYLIAKVLESAGYKVGMTSTFLFKIGDDEWVNDTKQTMQGRFNLQKLLRKIVKAGCHYAVVETSSEGILQSRHVGIIYDILVFTNLSPEHIEAHGSFENYKRTKGIIFKNLNKSLRKKISLLPAFASSSLKVAALGLMKKIIIANLDDEQADYFLDFAADEKIGFNISSNDEVNKKLDEKLSLKIIAKNPNMSTEGVRFNIDNTNFNLGLYGEFNIYNSLSAIAVGLSQGIEINVIRKALEKMSNIPGRLEEIKNDKGFRVFVDYAHEPKGLEEVYKTIKIFNPRKIISILGSQGGGRDKAKRPVLGELAARYTDYVIVTNEDPYDENPQNIINDVFAGVAKQGKVLEKNAWKILDREEAIAKAISLARKGDVIVITGKGCEQSIVIKNNKKIPWDDRKVVRRLVG